MSPPRKQGFSPALLADMLARRFTTEPANWTAEEADRIAAIRSEKYANPEWNEKR